MISSLRIINFKSLADTGLLNLRPLTFLVGPNSSGKSSIIQSLLLLRQTVQSRDVKNPLNINGPYVQLGSYPDLLFLHEYKAPLHFEFSFNTGSLHLQPIKFSHIDQPIRRVDNVTFEVTFGYNKKTMQVYLNLNGGSHAGQWVRVTTARADKTMWRSGKVARRHNQVLLNDLGFDPSDIIFVGVAFEGVDRIIVTEDSDYSTAVRAYRPSHAIIRRVC
jgi:predicted ATPase